MCLYVFVCLSACCLSVCLSVRPSVSQSVSRSACLPVCLFVCLSVCLCVSVCLCACVCLSARLSKIGDMYVCVCGCVFVRATVHTCLPGRWECMYMSACACAYVFVCVCVCVSDWELAHTSRECMHPIGLRAVRVCVTRESESEGEREREREREREGRRESRMGSDIPVLPGFIVNGRYHVFLGKVSRSHHHEPTFIKPSVSVQQ